MVNYKTADTSISKQKLLDVENYPEYAERREVFSLPCIGYCSNKTLQLEIEPGNYLYIPTKFISESFYNGNGKDIEAIKCVGRDIEFIMRKTADGYVPSRYDAIVTAYKRISAYPLGTAILGRVISLAQFGAFVDIGSGVIGLLPVRLQSVSHTSRDEQRFAVGDEIPVILYNNARGRFTLTTIPFLGSFQENLDLLEDYSTVVGVVRSVQDYGAFVEITPNLVGLSGDEGTSYKPGDKVSVCIRSVREDRTKLRIMIVDKVPKDTPCTIPRQWFGPLDEMKCYLNWYYNFANENDKMFFDFERGVGYGRE